MAPTISDSMIEAIRAASRRLVRELGFMSSTLAGTSLPPSAVHAVIEIGVRGSMTATELCQSLNLEKSSVSRMLRKLVAEDQLFEEGSDHDGRAKVLALTPRGQRTLARIDAVARRQVVSALERLPQEGRSGALHGLSAYARALEDSRVRAPVSSPPTEARIATGYQPGIVGRSVELHARYYSREAGFGAVFESKVATGMAEFVERLDRPGNELWAAVVADRIVGVVAIDGDDLEHVPRGLKHPARQGRAQDCEPVAISMRPDDSIRPESAFDTGRAHLRWFIVEDEWRGAGIGGRLLKEAVEFCDKRGFAEIWLWTFKGLDAARRLYEANGFALVEEYAGRQWGHEVTEQRFMRLRGAG